MTQFVRIASGFPNWTPEVFKLRRFGRVALTLWKSFFFLFVRIDSCESPRFALQIAETSMCSKFGQQQDVEHASDISCLQVGSLKVQTSSLSWVVQIGTSWCDLRYDICIPNHQALVKSSALRFERGSKHESRDSALRFRCFCADFRQTLSMWALRLEITSD